VFSKLRPFLPSDIQEILQLADWNGKAEMKARATAQLSPAADSLEIQTNGQVAVTIPYFINNEWLVSTSGINLGIDFSGDPDSLRAVFRGKLKTFMLKDVLVHPIRGTRFSGQMDLLNLEKYPDSRIRFESTRLECGNTCFRSCG
jgi:hypothetical protein